MPTPSDNVAVNIPDPEHWPDKVGGPETTGMVGRTFEYQYPTGPQYRISFGKEPVYFTVPEQADGTKVIAIKYRQRALRPEQYLVHWIIPGRTGHVALVFDLEAKHVDCAALMPVGLFELFDRATLREIYENGESALYTGYE
ncbi:hypothetical protein BJX64DRAFT_300820 [Aspergillus heterothallicus]